MNLSQSGCKDWQNCCPRFWADKYIDGNRPSPNDDMLAGLVFETMCIGSSADGQQYTELRRLDSGQKSVRQLRIEKQAKKFKRMFDPEDQDFLGFTITEKQVKLTVDGREGTLDFIAQHKDSLDECIFDIKLTQDLQNGWWGDLSKVDWIQQIHYRELFYKKRGYYPDCYVLIFDTTPKENVKLIKLNISDKAVKDVEHRFSEVEEMIEEYITLPEFPRIPEPSQCAKCHLECNVRQLKPIVEYEEYDV